MKNMNSLSFSVDYCPFGSLSSFKPKYFVNDLSIGDLTPNFRIGDQVPTFDVFWHNHLQEVRSTVYIHIQSM